MRGRQLHRVFCRSSKGSRIEEAEEYSPEEVTYVRQGESALQEAISILGEQEGWTVETVAVSTSRLHCPEWL